jgi:hypothetical protein
MMREAVIILLLVFASGCVNQAPSTKPDDAKMDALFADAINKPAQTTTTQAVVETTIQNVPEPVEESSTTVTYAVATTSLPSSTSTTLMGPDCTDIKVPMGRIDCEKGYCPLTSQKCAYIPGNIYGGNPSRCVCVRN